MSLLPKDTKEFGSKDYWNNFFSSRGSDPFEWYGQYTELYSYLHSYIKATDALLVAGCGNSTLSADLYKVGYKHITNVDVSEVVIRQMTAKYQTECPDMLWCRDDLTNSNFSDGSYSCVLDKGTLDAIFTDDSVEVVSTVEKYLKEMSRILRLGGRYVCISLLQEHIAQYLLKFSVDNGWMLRVCRCEEAEKATKSQGKFTLPVFVIICTKLKPIPGIQPIIEGALDGPSIKPHRSNTADLCTRIKDLQQYSAITHALLTKVSKGEEARMELCDSLSASVRYVLYILDAPSGVKTQLPMGVFIVPQRRECEWLFATPEGRRQICVSASASRLVVVHLVRGQQYDDGLEMVQSELSGRVMDLAPSNMPKSFKVPFLSVGGDVGSAARVFSGNSEWSGDYIVEDVRVDDGATLRRLVFLNNSNVVQSEVRLLKSNKKKTNKKGNKTKAESELDHGYLSCSHHLAMIQGLGLVKKESRLMIIGLGGGPLATFIHNHLNKLAIEAVELDSEMVEVAKQWFGFRVSQRMTVKVMDGIDYCKLKANDGEKYDSIMLDVDSKDVSVGMSCPPQSFLEIDFLNVMATCLQYNGVLIVNIVCRDSVVWEQSLKKIKSVFSFVICQSIPNEVNKILYCRRPQEDTGQSLYLEEFKKGLHRLESTLGKDLIDVPDILEEIKQL